MAIQDSSMNILVQKIKHICLIGVCNEILDFIIEIG